jgi:quercetin dioxygenase-like cupin family protein
MRALHSFVFGVALGGVVAVAGVKAAQPETDPVKQSPQLYTVRFENERVRVLEYRLEPGQKEPMHSHPPGIVYTLSDAKLRMTASDGSTTESTRSAGNVMWRDFTTHAAENVGTTEAHALAIELKPDS